MISPVFASRSPSAGKPLGVVRLFEMARGSAAPLIALGGVNARTAGELLGSGAAGLAGVEAFGA
jgi:thiamine-phosphate pyrophosphorylase